MDLSAIVSCYNEAEQLPALFASLKGIDDIVLIDHLSTDNTAEIAQKLGARVYIKPNTVEKVTDQDVKDFVKMFGYSPIFQAGNTIPNHATERNVDVEYCKNDWIFYPDADEIVTWDIDKIKETMKESDMIVCDFIHTRKPDGSPAIVFDTTKLYRKSKAWWTGRTHSFVTGYDAKIIKDKSMVINHYQRPKEIRATYLPSLEFNMVKDQDSRTAHYLGREYFKYGEYEKAKKMLNISLRSAFNVPEIQSSYVYLAKCSFMMGNSNEAKVYCFEAIKIDPSAKDPLLTMAEFCKPEEAKYWIKFAQSL